MKDKLKAIWRILRAKSYFYTVHINGKYISNHELGNQPKGGYPAYARVEIMFGELRSLALVAKEHIRTMENRYYRPSFIDRESTKPDSVYCTPKTKEEDGE